MKIGLFCPDATDIYQRNLIGAFSKKAVSAGHELAVISTNVLLDDPESALPETRLLSLVGHPVFDGVALLADSIFHRIPMGQARNKMSILGDKPWVSLDKISWHPTCVTLDNAAALPPLMDHLYEEHGYRDYLFLLGPLSSNDAQERASFFLDYMEKKGPGLRWVTLVCDFWEEKAYHAVVSYFQSAPPFLPRVIVASNDNMALGALRALRFLGLSCPQDCAVTGFDDVEEAALESPSLTTVHQPLDAVASRALEALLDPGAAERGSTVVPTRLVVRESCGCRSSRVAVKDYRAALSLHQSLRIRGETLLGASAAFGVHVNGSLSLDALLSHLQDHCQALAVPRLHLALVGEEAVPFGGVPSQWREIYRFGPRGGERLDAPVPLDALLFSPHDHGPHLVHSVSLLHAEGRVIGLLGCTLPVAWMGFLRLLASNLAGGLSRVGQWRTLLDHAEDLEVSMAQRNRDLTVAIRALKLENERRQTLELALMAERKALEDILEAQPIALVVLSAEGRRIRYYNRPFARLVGYAGVGAPLPPDAFSVIYGDLLAGTGGELKLPVLGGGTVPVLVGRTELQLRGEASILAGMMDLSLQKQLESDLLNISENDSRRFGQELHDDVCQKLAALAIFTTILDKKLEVRTGERLPEVAELSAQTKGILDHVRGLSRGLFPSDVGSLPLGKLMERLLQQVGTQTGLQFHWSSNWGDRPTGLGASDELHLFRIVQEAIQNTIKHAHATRVDLSLRREGGSLLVDYADDGTGPEPGFTEGLGMRSMRYRASQMGASLVWGTGPLGGFSFRLSLDPEGAAQ